LYKLVLIDADDTLFDFEKAETTALQQTFASSEIPGFDADVIDRYKAINKALWVELEKGLIDNIRLRVERFRRLFVACNIRLDAEPISSRYVQELGKCSFLLEDAEEVCRYLHAKYTVVMVTNGIKEVQYSRLEHSSIKNYIHDIVVSEDIGISKPDPRIFGHALERVGLNDKKSTLMIGDSLSSDIQGGINFGIDTCWLNPGNVPADPSFKPTYKIKQIKELFDIL